MSHAGDAGTFMDLGQDSLLGLGRGAGWRADDRAE
jgi:hypothetical protein